MMVHGKASNDKGTGERKRRIWRITEAAPAGEFIDSDQLAMEQQRPVAAVPRHPGWAGSTFDLLTGIEVSEDQSTVPAELFDELFKR